MATAPPTALLALGCHCDARTMAWQTERMSTSANEAGMGPAAKPDPAAATSPAQASAPAPAPDWRAVEHAASQGNIAEARALLLAVAQLPASNADASQRAAIRHWQLRLAPWWWAPLQGAGLMLRRTQADDADFWRQAYTTPDFARRYNRQAAWRGDLPRALARAGRLPPIALEAVHWVVCKTDGTRLGLASLSSLNLANAKAEFSIGFPDAGARAPLHAVLATLLVYHFSYFVLGLNKLYTYVYRDNTRALHNSLRVGLRQEGLLHDHFHLPPGEFVDVYAMGLTRAQLLQDSRLVQMAQRRLGLDWASRRSSNPEAAST